jgi:hypothetical protein
MNIKIYKLELYVHILHCGDSSIMIMCVCVFVFGWREKRETHTQLCFVWVWGCKYIFLLSFLSHSAHTQPHTHTHAHTHTRTHPHNPPTHTHTHKHTNTHTYIYIYNPIDSPEHISMHTFLIFKQNTLLNICEEKESEMSPSPGANVIKLLRPYFTHVGSKLERLSLAGLCSLF